MYKLLVSTAIVQRPPSSNAASAGGNLRRFKIEQDFSDGATVSPQADVATPPILTPIFIIKPNDKDWVQRKTEVALVIIMIDCSLYSKRETHRMKADVM